MKDSVDAVTQWARLVERYPAVIPAKEIETFDQEVLTLLSFGVPYVRRDDPKREVVVIKPKRTAHDVKPEHYRLKTVPQLDFEESRVHRFLQDYVRKSDHLAAIRREAIAHTIRQDLV